MLFKLSSRHSNVRSGRFLARQTDKRNWSKKKFSWKYFSRETKPKLFFIPANGESCPVQTVFTAREKVCSLTRQGCSCDSSTSCNFYCAKLVTFVLKLVTLVIFSFLASNLDLVWLHQGVLGNKIMSAWRSSSLVLLSWTRSNVLLCNAVKRPEHQKKDRTVISCQDNWPEFEKRNLRCKNIGENRSLWDEVNLLPVIQTPILL